MVDKTFGNLEFDRYVWWRNFGKKYFHGDKEIELLVQDNEKEGILDIQRDAFKSYEKFEERYVKEVPQLIIDYYKWNFEVVNKIVGLDENTQKDTISKDFLYEMIQLSFLFICRNGSYGWIFANSWDKDGFAVLLSETDPIVISRNQLRNLHKLNDNSFGLLIHDNEKKWTTWNELPFFDEIVNVLVEVEGGVDENVTSAQQKAYTQYLLNKSEYIKQLSNILLAIYMGKDEAEKLILENKPVAVKTVIPKRLFIDKSGNFGWICYTQWDDSYIGVLLSEQEIHFMDPQELYTYSTIQKIDDSICGRLYVNGDSCSRKLLIRLFDKMSTLVLNFRSKKGFISDVQRDNYQRYLSYDKSYWESMKDVFLDYYLRVYDALEEYMDIPDYLKRENVTRDTVMDIVSFTKLHFSDRGKASWLAESPIEEEDGLAFEFSTGKIILGQQIHAL